uniref:Uncharacterized protein n=1 Tax=Macaca fascicularis TaxID=9541 RepID=A0A2K5UH13_MACFA
GGAQRGEKGAQGVGLTLQLAQLRLRAAEPPSSHLPRQSARPGRGYGAPPVGKGGKGESRLKRPSVLISALTWKRLVAASAKKKKGSKKVTPKPASTGPDPLVQQRNRENLLRKGRDPPDGGGTAKPLAVPVPTVPAAAATCEPPSGGSAAAQPPGSGGKASAAASPSPAGGAAGAWRLAAAGHRAGVHRRAAALSGRLRVPTLLPPQGAEPRRAGRLVPRCGPLAAAAGLARPGLHYARQPGVRVPAVPRVAAWGRAGVGRRAAGRLPHLPLPRLLLHGQRDLLPTQALPRGARQGALLAALPAPHPAAQPADAAAQRRPPLLHAGLSRPQERGRGRRQRRGPTERGASAASSAARDSCAAGAKHWTMNLDR